MILIIAKILGNVYFEFVQELLKRFLITHPQIIRKNWGGPSLERRRKINKRKTEET